MFELQIANINHLFEESEWSFDVMMSNATPPPLPSLSDDDRSALDSIKRKLSHATDIPYLEQKTMTWYWVLLALSCLLALVMLAIIVLLVREIRLRRTRDLSTCRGPDVENGSFPAGTLASTAPDGTREEQELDISLVHVQ